MWNVTDGNYDPVLLSWSDYYAFGMTMPGRNGGVDYRYQFNGMEHDGELSGNGNSYTTEFRQYDPRLGRWKSLDPKKRLFPSVTPYNFVFNNPVILTDPKGDCPPCAWAALRASAPSIIALFATGATISVTLQFTTHYALEEDFIKAFGKVDWFDVGIDGAINVVTGNASSLSVNFVDAVPSQDINITVQTVERNYSPANPKTDYVPLMNPSPADVLKTEPLIPSDILPVSIKDMGIQNNNVKKDKNGQRPEKTPKPRF
ncbi:hypothetical protein GCM10009118_25380 [Wandonia haliotis]|uniref:RHS repeat-associated core domain-containing protein n=2 Tax=Wandonia haliotis TaxID=574963 RepID=A0ABN1MS47_9FLAO